MNWQRKFHLLIPLVVITFFDFFKPRIQAQQADIVYEVFVQSFCDSNGDGIGDLPGLISKLDYLENLGITSLWMMPVHPSPSYHKYDVTDFSAIHPTYGTMADMDSLIREAHRRHMKVILDLVINHTSDQHPWFISSAENPKGPHGDFYVWKNFDQVKNEIEKKSTTFDSDNITQWHPHPKRDEHFYGFFWKGMPDLNFDSRQVREEVYAIGKFWLDKGIDGFRLDAAKHIYPDDQLDKTRLFWKEFTSTMRAIKPDVRIIGEVWSTPETLASLFSGLPSMFNFEWTKSIPDAIQHHSPNRFMDSYHYVHNAYVGSGNTFEDAILLSNHDMNRIRSVMGGDIEKSKQAASILLTLPGTPYLYYGEEIGMLGAKPDEEIREPFLWGNGDHGQTTWQQNKNSTEPHVTSLATQRDDPASIWNHYRQWISLRKKYNCLSEGALEFIQLHHPNALAYVRRSPKNEILIVHLLHDQPAEILIPDSWTLLTGTPKKEANGNYHFSPYTSAAFLKK